MNNHQIFKRYADRILPVDFPSRLRYNNLTLEWEVYLMSDSFGSDFMTIVDEDGTEYELEVLTTLEYNGFTYLAVIPADDTHPELDPLEVSILKSVDEDGDSILCAIEDEKELEAVYQLVMDSLYDDEDE
jgi:uncharacterized protein YrzB (UPF0473 family)